MKLFDGADALPLAMEAFGRRSVIHPLLLHGEDGITLVDTGFPGQGKALEDALQAYGLQLSDVDRIILTHQDVDHVGNLPQIVASSHATVMAHADDAPYIDGTRPPIKMQSMAERLPAEMLERMRPLLEDPPKAPVDRLLADGETVPIHGGVQVIHTPGHTPGHLCLYLLEHKVLIAGDALTAQDGKLMGPSESASLDISQARASLGKLPEDAEWILCYHGGLVGPEAGSQLRALRAGM